MALQIDVTNENGIITGYHRLNKATIYADGSCDLEVYSYANSWYREKEKQDKANNELYNQLMDFINKENEKPEMERDKEAVIEWSEQINEMERQWVDLADPKNQKHILVSEYHFEGLDVKSTFNYKSAYAQLKTLDIFKDAKDILEDEESEEK